MLSFDETWMNPAVLQARVPNTSRVEKRRAKGQRTPVHTKGLSRSAVVKVRINKDVYEIRVKGTRDLVGIVRKSVQRGVGYGYKLNGDHKAHNGFPTQEAAILRMLTKV